MRLRTGVGAEGLRWWIQAANNKVVAGSANDFDCEADMWASVRNLSGVTPTARIVVREDVRGMYRWAIVAGDQIVAVSGETAFGLRARARTAAERVRAYLAEDRVELPVTALRR